jgi:tetratricopeptide (TPR) repeat protein
MNVQGKPNYGEGDAVNDLEVQDLVAKGMTALENDHVHLALVCFERAAEAGESPTICSGLGYCLAAARGELEKGASLCREAITREPDNVFHYRNLGNALLLAGNRNEALEVFREGLRIRKDDWIIRKLDSLGTRKPPVFTSLSRKNFLNRTVGLILDRLGFR